MKELKFSSITLPITRNEIELFSTKEELKTYVFLLDIDTIKNLISCGLPSVDAQRLVGAIRVNNYYKEFTTILDDSIPGFLRCSSCLQFDKREEEWDNVNFCPHCGRRVIKK